MKPASGQLNYLKGIYLLMILVIFLLPFYSLENYTMAGNTTSHLGAQHTPNAWVMNLTFVLLGLSSILGGWKFLGKYWFHKAVLLVFGTALAMTALFRHAPIDPSLDYSVKEDQLHSLFANLTGFSFSVFAVSLGFIARRKKHRIWAFAIAVLAPLLSALMFYGPTAGWMGIWQRVLFIGMFGWMIYAFSNYELKP